MAEHEIIQRARQALAASGTSHAMLSSPANIRYLSGHTIPIETGPSPFAAGWALVLIGPDGPLDLIVPDSDEAMARATAPADLVRVHGYTSYTYTAPIDPLPGLTAILDALLAERGWTSGPLGLEMLHLPAAVAAHLAKRHAGLIGEDITGALDRVRAVKTAAEIVAMRRVLAIVDVGQEAVIELAQPGRSEVELFALLRARCEEAAGTRLPYHADMVSGVRTGEVGGPPTGRRLHEGDLVMADLAPQLNGYWGDSCNVFTLGTPTDEWHRLRQGIAAALQRGIEAAKPGVRACDLDAIVREAIRAHGPEYPHHTGHGLGTTFHEEPRITPYNTMPLEPNMVIALEPGIYYPGKGGIRLEHILLVTENGAEVLSHFPHTESSRI